MQGPILSITGDALVRHGVQKESTKLQLTSVFVLFFKEAKYRQILTWRGKISPDFDLERWLSTSMPILNRVEKGQHRQKATYWSKYFHYKTLQTLIPLAVYDEPRTFPAARWLH